LTKKAFFVKNLDFFSKNKVNNFKLYFMLLHSNNSDPHRLIINPTIDEPPYVQTKEDFAESTNQSPMHIKVVGNNIYVDCRVSKSILMDAFVNQSGQMDFVYFRYIIPNTIYTVVIHTDLPSDYELLFDPYLKAWPSGGEILKAEYYTNIWKFILINNKIYLTKYGLGY
jgi:hypothetical protein